MALGWSATIANDILDALANNSALTTLPLAECWIRLHTADPGSAGTTAIAGNATMKQVSFGAPSGGVVSNDAAITWTSGEVDTSEDYTHFTLWDDSSATTFLFSGTVTSNAVTSGDEFEIAVGDLDVSLLVAA